MMRAMKLRGIVQLEADRSLTFHSTLYDGSPVSLKVGQFDIETNEPFKPSKMRVDGWLFVQQEAQQNDVCYLTMPKPSLQHGHQITVKDIQLMPRDATIDDFRAKTNPKGTKLDKDGKEVVEEPEENQASEDE
jgi:hypothetical protein